MSLNAKEQERTRVELEANRELSGLDLEELADALAMSPQRTRSALALAADSDPVDVWQLRDYLELAVRAAGATPAPYTVLTDRARVQAARWFALRGVPTPR